MTTAPHRTRVRLTLEAVGLAIILVVYAAPFLASWRAMGFAPIPPRLTPDLYLHLVVSAVPRAEAGVVVNPWYHVPAQESALVYLRTGVALRGFHALASLLGDRLPVAVLLWTLLLTSFIWLSARWVVSAVLDGPPLELVALSLGGVLLFDFGYVQWMLSQALGRTAATVPAFPTLPYLRPFFPQASIPFLLLYLGMQIKVLAEPRWRYWLGMGALQLLALATFPFTAILMATLSGFALLFAACGRLATVRWVQPAVLVLLGGAVGLLYMAWTAPALRLLTGDGSLVRVDVTRVRLTFGYSVLVVAGLTLIVAVAVRRPPKVRYTLAGLGTGTAALLLSDGVVSTSLQASHHIAYLVHTTLAIMSVGLLGTVHRWLERHDRRHLARAAAATAAAGTLVYGGLAACATHRWYLPRNVARADLVTALSTAGPDDLIVAPNDMLEDETSWLPLATPAQVLFSSSADFVLDSAGAAEDARRLALFLFFRGETAESTRVALRQPGVSPHQRFLVGFRRAQLLSSGERERVVDSVERELLPTLRDAERLAPEIVGFFRRYRRILVVDGIGDPFFQASRVSAVVSLDGERYLAAPWILRWGRPR